MGRKLRRRFFDDEAAPLRGVEGLFIGQAAEIIAGNGDAEEQRVDKSDASRENIERGQRGFFVAGQDKPKNTREKKEDKRGLQGDRAVETEEAAYAKSEADRKEWCAR